MRRLNSLKSALTSVQFILGGVGQNETPLASNWVSSSVRLMLLKLMTALWLLYLQYLFLLERLRRRLRLRVLVVEYGVPLPPKFSYRYFRKWCLQFCLWCLRFHKWCFKYSAVWERLW